MSDKTYQIELIIYGMPDWWLTSSWSNQPWLSEEPYKTVETTFHGTLTELEVSESSFRRAAGIKDDIYVLTWRDLSDRREAMQKRLMNSDSAVRVVSQRG